jgi:hypothetical protein
MGSRILFLFPSSFGAVHIKIQDDKFPSGRSNFDGHFAFLSFHYSFSFKQVILCFYQLFEDFENILTFPAIFLCSICTMHMVVKENGLEAKSQHHHSKLRFAN